jgi:hypothetical protein
MAMHNSLIRLRRAYGANPLHLLGLVACFALAGYVATRLISEPLAVRILIWFAAAVIGHDLVLFPLYALADRSLQTALQALPSTQGNRTPVVPPLNYLRIPALGAALLLLLFLPGIIQQGQQTYLSATGQTQQPYLARWLLLTAAMFALSALIYAARSRRAAAPLRTAVRQLRPLIQSHEQVITIAHRTPQRAGALLTTRALYYLNSEQPPRWRRISWTDIADLQWHTDTHTLTVTGPPGAPTDHATIHLTGPANLIDTAHDLINTTTIATHPVDRGATHQAPPVRDSGHPPIS